jgi:hypothetical protein
MSNSNTQFEHEKEIEITNNEEILLLNKRRREEEENITFAKDTNINNNVSVMKVNILNRRRDNLNNINRKNFNINKDKLKLRKRNKSDENEETMEINTQLEINENDAVSEIEFAEKRVTTGNVNNFNIISLNSEIEQNLYMNNSNNTLDSNLNSNLINIKNSINSIEKIINENNGETNPLIQRQLRKLIQLLIAQSENINNNIFIQNKTEEFTLTAIYQKDHKICSICFDNVNFTDKHYLRCGHIFHAVCIAGWLRIKNICPNCKQQQQTIDRNIFGLFNFNNWSELESEYDEISMLSLSEESVIELRRPNINMINRSIFPNFDLNNININSNNMRSRIVPSFITDCENCLAVTILYICLFLALHLILMFKVFHS